MKRFLLVSFTILLSLNAFCQKTYNIALMHPTIHNIKSFEYLVNKHFITIKNVKIVAITFDAEDYNFSETKKYVEKNKLQNVEFIDLAESLKPDELYKVNHLSPQFKEIMEKTDAIIFPGGDDLPAYTYGGETSLLNVNLNPQRHYIELSFLFHLYGGFQNINFKPLLQEKPNYVVMGICLGSQTMNVAAGGTMVQDIPSELYQKKTYDEVTKQNPEEIHRSPWYNIYSNKDLLSCSFHHIKFNGNYSKEFYKSNHQPLILSCHHQAMKKIGKDFEVWAWSLDGKVPEGIRHTKYKNVFAVQFHPEATILYKKGSLYKIKPSDKEKTDISTLLKEQDMIFHKAIWKHFSELVYASIKK